LTRIVLSACYYIAALLLITFFHNSSPTNLFLFDLEAVVIYLLGPLISILLLVRSLKKVKAGDQQFKPVVTVHWMGMALTAVALGLAWVL